MPADADILGKTNLHGWQIFQESMERLLSSLDQGALWEEPLPESHCWFCFADETSTFVSR